jgi:uncharacterized membrane protein YkvA (DUF1232 family)
MGWLLARDPSVPGRSKAALVSALGYAVSPIDPIPGVIPVLGQLDDMAVLILAVRYAIRSTPATVVDRHLQVCGLDREIMDRDIVVIRAVAVWLVGKTATGAARLGRWAAARVVDLANRTLGGRSPKPLPTPSGG